MFGWLSVSFWKGVILLSLKRLHHFIGVFLFNITEWHFFLLWSLQWLVCLSHKHELFINLAVFQRFFIIFFNACNCSKKNTLTFYIFIFRITSFSFNLFPILFWSHLTGLLVFFLCDYLGESLILFNLPLNLINNSINLVFVQLGYVILRRQWQKGFNNNLALTHQIHQFRINISITFPYRIRNNLIQFFKPTVQSNLHMLWSLRVVPRAHDLVPKGKILQIELSRIIWMKSSLWFIRTKL